MTETPPQAPPATEAALAGTASVKLPPEVETAFRVAGHAAAARLSALIEGNGLKDEKARLLGGTVEAHALAGAVILSLAMTLTKMANEDSAAEQFASEAELRRTAEAATSTLLERPETRNVILSELLKEKSGGFGLPQEITIPLPAFQRSFRVDAPCGACNGAGATPCARCNATGEERCLTCGGQGGLPCPTCFGTGMMQAADGTRSPCTACATKGKIPCPACGGRGGHPCAQCRGQRALPCRECRQTGRLTAFYQASYKAAVRFEPNWRSIGDDARAAAEAIGLVALVADKHAYVDWQKPTLRGPELLIPCAAFFPMVQAEVSLGGKTYALRAAGMRGRLIEAPPLLDALVKPGLVALKKLSQGSFAARPLLETACKYRLVKAALTGVARAPKKQVYKALARDYPLILSDKYARATVSYAARALEALGKGPRLQGLMSGVLLGALPALAYHFAAATHAPFGYALAGAVGAALAVYASRMLALSTLARLLPAELRPALRADWHDAAAALIPLALGMALAFL